MKTGRIIRSLAGYYDLMLEDGTVERTRARGQFRKRGQKPLVGDWADFESENGEGLIWALHERENSLVRPPMANVDLAIVVTSVVEPAFSQNLLDRQLVALEAEKVHPVLYFSKLDLLDEAEQQAFRKKVALYQKIGYPVIFSTDDVKQSFAPLLKDQVVVAMGQTGAGKSTLLNELAPELQLTVGEVSQALSRGKHTTRQVSLIPVPAYETLIADTPGFSSYEVFDFPVEELGNYFPEIREVAVGCRFRTCSHLNEPGCAVKEAVELGSISAERYNSYELFYQIIKGKRPVYQKNSTKWKQDRLN
ncbi:ribosome small subunit-dependent GTPase A [Fructobacillus sp. M1-13]|uniref:Small ribosomal subunit biogenesis GTPase RsgA n=1 Tax=Fructobacillus papyriferae TaxID=2713171 RepID=A0ABS5QN31_9LACO|nr:ribosome small subunit-dependent GTPase A [Fructobacillus papyriferae]MBS9334488.1 ribosome small subunit-dependent GTPase A [Fructobacillus papyriferae]MCD2158477.1 ribosome small subunit-dependent GTPase A [Fructobacillus papyriferae]